MPVPKTLRSVPLLAALATFLGHLFGNPHYGYFRDELYFIVCGFHPSWGYVDQPPLVPLLAAGSQLTGHSLFLLRAVAALFGAATTAVSCVLAAELGAGAFGQIVAGIACAFAPVLMNFGMKLSTDTPGSALWPLVAYGVVRVVKGGSARWWLVAGAALGVTLEAKYSGIFFAVALCLALSLSPERRLLRSRWCWAGMGLAVVLALPSVLWQAQHGFPMLELLRNGQHGKNVQLGPLQFFAAQFLITNPLLALVWIAGLVWSAQRSEWRFFAVTWALLMLQMLALHAKHYYPADVYPIVFALGGVAIEEWTRARRLLRPLVAGLALAAGLALVPFAMPVLPVPTFIAYAQAFDSFANTKLTKTENHADGALPQDWADMQGWPELVDTVAQVAASLSPEERARALIATNNYGEAAALDFLGSNRGLPPIVSGHNQYWLWGTHGRDGSVVIDVNGDCGAKEDLFQSSQLGAKFTNPWMMPYESPTTIRVCRGLKRPIEEVWPLAKHYI